MLQEARCAVAVLLLAAARVSSLRHQAAWVVAVALCAAVGCCDLRDVQALVVGVFPARFVKADHGAGQVQRLDPLHAGHFAHRVDHVEQLPLFVVFEGVVGDAPRVFRRCSAVYRNVCDFKNLERHHF